MKEFVDKIVSIFNKNFLKEKRDSIWDWCVSEIKKVELNEYNLENMTHNNLIWGIFGGTVPEKNREALIRLAEALGVAGISNPEGGQHGAKPRTDINLLSNDQLLISAEERLPMKVYLPDFTGGRIYSKTDKGIITDRHCHYLWITKRIIELCPDRNSAIIEIGSGLGLLGYFLDKAGYKDYTSIDLAYSNAIQTYFLGRNLPDRNFILSGDVKKPFDRRYKDAIKILHSSDFENVPKNRFAIMINIDSMTEMLIEEARKYVESDCTPIFLSINHEVNNFRVIELQKPPRTLKYRYPFWIRPGYVEELYMTT